MLLRRVIGGFFLFGEIFFKFQVCLLMKVTWGFKSLYSNSGGIDWLIDCLYSLRVYTVSSTDHNVHIYDVGNLACCWVADPTLERLSVHVHDLLHLVGLRSVFEWTSDCRMYVVYTGCYVSSFTWRDQPEMRPWFHHPLASCASCLFVAGRRRACWTLVQVTLFCHLPRLTFKFMQLCCTIQNENCYPLSHDGILNMTSEETGKSPGGVDTPVTRSRSICRLFKTVNIAPMTSLVMCAWTHYQRGHRSEHNLLPVIV